VLLTILPLAVYVAVIWVLGRLHRDQEMTVMRASGFSWQLMLRPLFNLLLPVATAVFIIGIFVVPAASQSAQTKLQNAFRTAAEWGLQTGQFHELQNGNLILYVEAVEKDGRTLRNIFIQQRDEDREQVWIAEKGYYWLDEETGERYLTLENGQITEGGKDTLDFRIVQFSRNDLRLPEPESKASSDDINSRPSKDLLFTSLPEEAAEIQWRVSPALGILVLGLLAIPLSHSAPREGRGGRVVLGVLAYTIYANVLFMDRAWIASGAMPPALGLWWVHVVTLAIAVIWLRRQGRLVN
jgi:lipopolysaccharide export system permease protein